MELDLFYTAGSEQFKNIVTDKLRRVFKGLNVKDKGKLEVFDKAWEPDRRQFDAYTLLDYTIRCMTSDYALWVVDEDIYCENVNFVFGLAMYNIAGVVSIFRLDSPEMVAKEAIHEVGHILGLRHCKNRCVMQFSNTLEEARKKPDTLCSKCHSILNRKIIETGQIM
ncbi:peptidase [Methanocella sp. CWC-04]|uniref:Peptidase n=1 Tax=Methanooceanicella nereidis TaxID=2052831 RepID=A0AAP2RC80_9EURY|nr:peptidase [Methanocella sp. CWC-04]MCD1293612.1 peptidase [Methanocella sp. CWC-04]